MQTISLLMFNRNENEGIIRNVKLLKDAVDEIVVIDNSDPEKYKQLKNSLKNFKVKLFRTLPLGYVEPLYYYGINKTTSEYILKLDADEEPSKELIKKIKERNLYYSVYEILFKDKKGKSLGYMPFKLFAKSSIKKITGIIHTGIEFKENPKKFPRDAYIIHHYEKPIRSSINKNYMEIESHERPITVYIDDLKKRKVFAGSLLFFIYNLPKPINVYLTAFGIGFGGSIYHIVLHHNSDWIQQISYWAFCWTKYNIDKMKFFNSLPKEEQKLRVKIAKEIQDSGGVIRYLGLDKDYIVENLTKTFKWNMSGIEAFKRLLLYKHFHRKPAYKFPYKLSRYYIK
jgi:hypothetical protein